MKYHVHLTGSCVHSVVTAHYSKLSTDQTVLYCSNLYSKFHENQATDFKVESGHTQYTDTMMITQPHSPLKNVSRLIHMLFPYRQDIYMLTVKITIYLTYFQKYFIKCLNVRQSFKFV
jgi:hypothetical protein